MNNMFALQKAEVGENLVVVRYRPEAVVRIKCVFFASVLKADVQRLAY